MSAVLPVARMRSKGRDGGFTLVELLVVVAIIMLLVAVSISYLAQARQKAKRVACQAQISSLNAACETYQLAQGTYPGVWNNANIGSGTWSGSEMMVASLLGGVVQNIASLPGPNVTIPTKLGDATKTYSLPKVGLGPVTGFIGATSETTNLQQLEAYYPAKDGEIADFDGNGVCEIMDKGLVGMPILYFRSFVGKPGIAFNSSMSGANNNQYNFDHNRNYFDPAKYKSMRLLSDIISSKQATASQADPTRQGYKHALSVDSKFATYITALSTVPAGTANWSVDTGWSTIAASGSALTARPYNTDRFLLISAGEDGYFGPNPNLKTVGTLLGDIQQCDDVFNWSRQ